MKEIKSVVPAAEPDYCDISIIIPARDEEESLPAVLMGVKQAMEGAPETWEVIVVSDHSKDRTAEIAREQGATVLENPGRSGKGMTLRTGFSAARGKYLLMLDADGSHRPEDMLPLVKAAQGIKGMAIGSRIYGGSQEYTRVRAFGNVILTWWFGFLHGRYLSDALNGFKAFPREVFESFKYTSSGFEIEIELLVNTLHLGRPVIEILSNELPRSGGESKLRVLVDGFRFFWKTLILRFHAPRLLKPPRYRDR